MELNLPKWFWVTRRTIFKAFIWAIVLLILVLPSLSFLIQAFSPRLFGQGAGWFTLANVSEAFSLGMGRSLLNSLWVSTASALIGTICALALAFIMERTSFRGKGVFIVGLWAVLLAPSYLVAVGWEEIVVRSGFLGSLGLWSGSLQSIIMGPAGVVLILALKGVPFAYFAVAPSLGILGGDLEQAVRVHGGNRFNVIRIVGPVLLPAIMSALVIVFAESVGDFGVAATIAATAHFPVATFTLYQAIGSYPANFGVAAVVGWALIIAVGCALIIQSRLTKGKKFTVLSGRTRVAAPIRLTWKSEIISLVFVLGFFAVALGVPIIGVVSSSILIPFTGLHFSSLTLSNYRGLLGVKGLSGPILFSGKIALVCAVAIVVLGAVLARILSFKSERISAKLLDITLLSAVALPGIVFAAGYIFAYNLPVVTNLGIVLYGTVPLLAMAYVANSIPQSTRIMLGPFSQIQENLLDAARIHGAGSFKAWRSGVLPLLARPILWAGLLSFSAVFLELPISELLSPPGVVPVSVAILRVLGKADIGLGTALSVVAVLFTLLFVTVVLAVFRLVTPERWRKWHLHDHHGVTADASSAGESEVGLEGDMNLAFFEAGL